MWELDIWEDGTWDADAWEGMYSSGVVGTFIGYLHRIGLLRRFPWLWHG